MLLNFRNVDTAKEIVKSQITIPQYMMDNINPSIDLTVVSSCKCPMHEERTPSFMYNSYTRTFGCYGKCHIFGDVIVLHKSWLSHLIDIEDYTLYSKLTKLHPNELNYYTCLQDLAQKYGLQIPDIEQKKTTNSTHTEYTYDKFLQYVNSTEKRKSQPIKSQALLPIRYCKTYIEGRIMYYKTTDWNKYIALCTKYDTILTLGVMNVIHLELNNLYTQLKNKEGDTNVH